MLHELLLSLSGHPSPLLSPDSTGGNRDHGPFKDLLSPAEHALLRTLSQDLGERHRSIRENAATVSSSHASVVCRAVSVAITFTHLTAFQRKILEVEKEILQGSPSIVGAYNTVPLSAIVTAFDGWGRKLQWLQEVIKFIQTPNNEGRKDGDGPSSCTAADLIQRLRDATLTGYPDIESMALNLVKVAEMAWLKQLSAWALYGRHPGGADFFIEKVGDDGKARSSYNSYTTKPSLVPCFVTPQTANSILFVGRSLCHLRDRQPTASSSYRISSPEFSLLPKHLAELTALKSPISAASLSAAIVAIRLSLSQNALQKLLPISKVIEILHVLKDFFLLERGEFAVALITAGDDRLSSRYNRGPDRRKAGVDPASDLASLTIRDGEVHNVLARTWTALVSLETLDDEGVDEELDRARELITLSIKSLDSHAGRENANNHTQSTTSFDDLLLPSPTVLSLRVPSPLDLFLTADDINTYSRINAYLLAIRRAHLHLCKLFQLSVLRRTHPSPSSTTKSSNSLSSSTKAMRPIWATISTAVFFFAELGEYLQGEVIQSSWSTFQDFLSPSTPPPPPPPPPPSIPPSIATPQGNPPAGTTSLPSSLNRSIPPANSRPSSSRKSDEVTTYGIHDPETLALAHRSYLSTLTQEILLDDTAFTSLLRRQMTSVDHLCGLMNRLDTLHRNAVDTGGDEETGEHTAQAHFEAEQKRVMAELRTLRVKVGDGGKGLVERLREVDNERAGGKGRGGVGSGVFGGEDGGFVPWSSNGLERLLLKFDYGDVRGLVPWGFGDG